MAQNVGHLERFDLEAGTRQPTVLFFFYLVRLNIFLFLVEDLKPRLGHIGYWSGGWR